MFIRLLPEYELLTSVLYCQLSGVYNHKRGLLFGLSDNAVYAQFEGQIQYFEYNFFVTPPYAPPV